MKYVNLKAFNFGWTPIATNPFKSSYVGTSFQPIAVIVNGMFGLLHIISLGNGVPHGAFLMLVNKTGQICTYATPDFVNNSANNKLINEPFNVKISGNTFQWVLPLSSTIYKWIIPNVFSAGTNYIVPYSSFIPFAPCATTQADFADATFLGEQGLIAYEFDVTFGNAVNVYASIYDSTNQLLGAGFIANVSSGSQNPFNQINSSLPLFTTPNDVYTRNGYNFFANMAEAPSLQYQVMGITLPNLNGDPTVLNCITGTPSVNVTAKSQSVIYPNRDFGCPDMGGQGSTQIATGITDMLGFFIIPESTHSMLLSKDWYIDLPALYNSASQSGTVGFVDSSKTWFLHRSSGTGNQTGGTIYTASTPPDLTPYLPAPNVNQSVFKGLANYHRAVSPSGVFQA